MGRADARTVASPAPLPLDRGHALFLDFDGTLVEIAPAPSLVTVSRELPRLLCALDAMLDGAIAIVSGRRIDDLAGLLAPFAGAMAGQHGLEIRRADGAVVRLLADAAIGPIRAALADFASRHPGVRLEDKGDSLALHFRQAPALAAACGAFVRRTLLETGSGLKAIDGKMVVELVPAVSGKARAIAALLMAPPFHGRVPVFVGDDTVDEEGFALVDRLGGISIHVGGGDTVARHRLASVSELRGWLARSLVR